MSEVKQKTGAKPSKRALDPKKKKRQLESEPTKEEYAVAKFVRFKCPTKKANFGHGMGGEEVVYFVGSKAVDCLMESKWSSTSKKGSKKKDQALFNDRQAAVDYMQQLLMRGLFFRAKKLVPKIKEKTSGDANEKKKGDQGKKGEIKDDLPKSPKAAKETEVKRRKKDKGEKEEEEKGGKEKHKDDGDDKEKSNEKSSKVRKVKLDWHNDQLFIDGQSIYVWKYDPTPLKTWLLGLGIVLGAAACCLFPLWPMQIRVGVYYISSSALVFIVFFFGFVVLRTVLFGLIWALTLGRHHFWLFPNLTEDCGVMESFKPVYSYKYMPSGSKSTDEKEKKKDKKSDSEDEGDGNIDEEDARESKDEQGEDRGSEIDSENEDQGKDGESATHDDADDYDDKSDGSSNENSAPTSTDEEPQTSAKKSPKKRRPVRRDDGQESSVNGDFEIVDNQQD